MKHRIAILAALAMAVPCAEVAAQDTVMVGEWAFAAKQHVSEATTLPYRQAVVGTGDMPQRLVIYLHGGTNRGDDNVSQLGEPGIDSIAAFVAHEQGATLFVVPQCPAGGSWGGRNTSLLHSLVSHCRASHPSISHAYIFGGSMGGTGTWSMVSKYPRLFTAAMPVAGNPTDCSADSVALTSVLTVMGTADRVIGMDAVSSFAQQLYGLGAHFMFNIEEGWSHEDVCTKSYTRERLSWIFANEQSADASAVAHATANVSAPVATQFFTLAGSLVEKPRGGVYIVRQTLANGQVLTRKVIVR